MINNAQYTVLLKSLMETPDTMSAITSALSDYPIYEKTSTEEYKPSYIPTRQELNERLLNHYKYHEIGFETIGRFIDELKISMNEIMPYYNELMFTIDRDYNIIFNVDYQRTIESTKEGNATNSQTGTNSATTTSVNNGTSNTTTSEDLSTSNVTNKNAKNVDSQTPQDNLTVTASNIDSVDYADNVKWLKENGTDTATSESDTTSSNTSASNETSETSSEGNASGETSTTETEGRTEITKGNFGVVSSQDLILKYRETILNVVQMIINDKRIKELFMLVW